MSGPSRMRSFGVTCFLTEQAVEQTVDFRWFETSWRSFDSNELSATKGTYQIIFLYVIL